MYNWSNSNTIPSNIDVGEADNLICIIGQMLAQQSGVF